MPPLQSLIQGTDSQAGSGHAHPRQYRSTEHPFIRCCGDLSAGPSGALTGRRCGRRKRVFDIHYLPWYVVHPFVSALLGGATALLILAGLSAVAQIGQGNYQETMTLIAVLSVISFSVGVSTHYIWRKLDSVLRDTLGEKSTGENNPKAMTRTTLSPCSEASPV